MGNKFQNINFQLEIPPIPDIAEKVLNLINSDESSASQLAEVVSLEPAVTARVLKIANSPFYSMSRQVTTLSKAIVVLGERTLKNLVLAASMRSIHRSFGKVERILWEDSMVCAFGARFLARKLQLVDPEEAFMAGLFRHVGKVIICNQAEVDGQVIAKILSPECKLQSELERKFFGASHAEIGATVLEKWRLSETMSQVALHHFDVDAHDQFDEKVAKMLGVVNIANAFPGILGILGAPQDIDLETLPGVDLLKLDSANLVELFAEFSEVFEENRQQILE